MPDGKPSPTSVQTDTGEPGVFVQDFYTWPGYLSETSQSAGAAKKSRISWIISSGFEWNRVCPESGTIAN